MSLQIQDYIAAAKSSNRQSFIQLQLLDNNENALEEIEDSVVSGDLSLTNQFGSHRNCNLVLENVSGQFLPSYRGKIWLNKKVKLITGLIINGEKYPVNRGIFVFSEIQAIQESANVYANITLLDKFSLLSGELAGQLKDSYVIPVGTDVETAVRAIMTDAGEIKTPIISISPVNTYYTITKQAGDTYASLLEDLSNMVSADCFYDKNGYLRFQYTPIDYNTGMSTKPSSWDFESGDSLYQGCNHRYKFDVYNYVICLGDNIQGSQVRQTAQDDNIFSPFRVSLVGERIYVVNDQNIYNNDLALQRAQWELYKKAIVNETTDITCVPIDTLEENQIITVLDSSVGLNREHYIINSINFPLLGDGSMSISCWKIRSFN